jgi:hypothetical protein
MPVAGTRASKEGRMKIELDLEDIWPPASTVVGMRFETDEDFERCEKILWQDWDLYRSVNPYERYVVVRKRDEHLFKDAGLRYERYELVDMDDLPTEERLQQEREMIEKYRPRLREWLKRQQP